ncbi:hypothetical protein AVEN_90610-1, partial [Araneus ventricosus]
MAVLLRWKIVHRRESECRNDEMSSSLYFRRDAIENNVRDLEPLGSYSPHPLPEPGKGKQTQKQ